LFTKQKLIHYLTAKTHQRAYVTSFPPLRISRTSQIMDKQWLGSAS